MDVGTTAPDAIEPGSQEAKLQVTAHEVEQARARLCALKAAAEEEAQRPDFRIAAALERIAAALEACPY